MKSTIRREGSRFRRLPVLITAAVLAIAAVAGGGVLAVNAFFTSQATVPGQEVTTATVEIEAGTASTSSPIQVSDLLPGDAESTSVILENTGSEDVYYTVRLPKTAGGDAVLEDELQVTVTVGATTEARSLTAWQTGALQIGPALAVGATQLVIVSIALPATAGNTLQGTGTGFGVQFDAIQARNTPVPTADWIAD